MSKRDPLEGVPAPKTPLSYEEEVRKRQRGRILVTGIALLAFAALLYAITIARMGGQ